jgi:large subunit ribosomal protein L4e
VFHYGSVSLIAEPCRQLPLVLADSVESVEKTSAVINILKQVSVYAEVEKANDLVQIYPGKRKMHNRRYINHKGLLIVYEIEESKIVKTFRNITGANVVNVKLLNLLKLTPGGRVGRFIIWTKSTFEKLDSIFGSFGKTSKKKKGFVLPGPKMLIADLAILVHDQGAVKIKTIPNSLTMFITFLQNPLYNSQPNSYSQSNFK